MDTYSDKQMSRARTLSSWGIVHGHGGGSFLHASMTNAASSDGQYNGNQVFNGYTLTNIGYNALNYAGYVTIERV